MRALSFFQNVLFIFSVGKRKKEHTLSRLKKYQYSNFNRQLLLPTVQNNLDTDKTQSGSVPRDVTTNKRR